MSPQLTDAARRGDGVARGLGVPPERCAYVGDQHDTDALAAAAAGMTGIWLNRQAHLAAGAVAPGESAPGESVPQIASLAELPALLAGR